MAIRKAVLIFAVLFCTNSYGGIYKCTDAKGRVTYSSSECKSKGSQSIDISKKIAKTAKINSPAETPKSELPSDISIPSSVEEPKKVSVPLNTESPKKVPSTQGQVSGCDGRTYCSQMTSCTEATFFLKNCPDTKMDGDMDGIPCEDQWCH